MFLLFNVLCGFVTAFLPKSVLISWLQSISTVILEAKKMKSVTVSISPPSICHEVMGPDAMILVFWMLSFKSAFSLSSFTLVAQLLKNLPAMPETWVGKIPWRRERLPTPVFWPREFHGLYSSWRHRVGHNRATSTPLSPLSRGSLVPLHSLPWYHLHIWGCWYFSWQSWFQLGTHPAWHFTWCTLHRSY